MTKKPEWSLAAINALAQGDIGNAIIASTPGGIEAQEAAGQRDLNALQHLLPRDLVGATWAEVEVTEQAVQIWVLDK